MNRFTRRIGDASARRPWVTIASWAVALLCLLSLAATVGGSFADDLVAPGSQSRKAMELLEERFPEESGGTAMAVFAAPGGQRLDRHRPAVDAAVARIAGVAHVASVAGPFTTGTVSPDGRIGFAAITFDVAATDLDPGQLRAVSEAIEPVRADGVVAELGGDAAFINAETETSGGEAAGLLVALVVLVVAFGTVVAALVPVVLALVAVATGLGAVALLAGALEVSTVAPTIGAMIGLGVGVDYALFITVRYREHRAAGQDNATALSNAMGSSGAAVVFAGGTVVATTGALALTGLGFLTSIGVSTALVVLLAVGTALTLLPALLSLLGDRVDRGRLGRRRPAKRAEDTAWWRFAHRVSSRPLRHLAVGAAVLCALGAPALGMQTGFPDAGDDSPRTTHRRAYDLLAEGFGPGVNAPLVIVADLRAPGVDARAVPALAERIAADPGIASVGAPRTSAGGDTVVLPALPTTAPADPATSKTLARVRALVPGNVAVSGLTAMTDDLTEQLSDTLPVLVAAVVGASFLLLTLVFRSLVIPLKAAVMNLLSIGGAYGVVVAVFQWGWLGSLLHLEGTLRIASPLPTIFFAVLFGLSMDYEVFLLSRIREEYDATGDNTESVARGMAATGRVITSAALIMTAVFGSFVVSPSPLVKMMGLGLTTAVVLDATVVRMVVVPAVMALMGRANWWLPRVLDRRLPRVAAHGSPVPDQARSGAPAAAGADGADLHRLPG
ncbi:MULTISPECIES: MMPL family transporter [unclassified Streptomyces]|uniref:MMPL family transporter n=1 Tax=unclassified Streptomyces TaxID=2593676 RepID=UPI001F04652E|nr:MULTISPECIES: MMPL family transporter [unclassified Streptomyces]MCH0563453.1 MMPL family transporter [Streptomyces sp. MUM 2J]MCH0570150.1 MMPL family transporter [Streptomyces sp. MUM 136J]